MTQASQQAFLSVIPSLPQKRRKVYEAILAEGGHGATIDRICARLGWTPNRVSGRLTELERHGLIKDTGARRQGQTIYIINVDGIEAATRPGKKSARRAAGRIVGVEPDFEASVVRVTVAVDAEQRWPSEGAAAVLRW